MAWTVGFLDAAAEAELLGLPRDMRAKFEHIVHMIENFGLEQVREPYVKHLEGVLWEMRLSGRDGIARSIYLTANGKRVVIMRTFRKKTQKTPRREIELALNRAKELK
ncbi:type II toxin-antitoxin system RelE/ParE family toxin [Novosphingobium sp.]|nr:type II toxin-antitoxin system RelE/ParE family toxin [Novosphingobium sp.]